MKAIDENAAETTSDAEEHQDNGNDDHSDDSSTNDTHDNVDAMEQGQSVRRVRSRRRSIGSEAAWTDAATSMGDSSLCYMLQRAHWRSQVPAASLQI